MDRPPRRKRMRQANKSLLAIAVSLMVLGAALLVGESLFRSNPKLASAAAAFNRPAMLAIGLGAFLLVIHGLLRRRKPGEPVQRPALNTTPSPPEPQDEPSPVQPAARANTWGPHVFTAIEWRRFEAVCEALFAQAGFETRVQPHGSDGGVNIWMHSKHVRGPVSVVQCKHWQGKRVGVRELHDLVELMAAHDLKRGTYATTSAYTWDARAFAQINGINTMDGSDLLALIATRTPEQQAALLAIAYEGKYWRPTCPRCGIKLVEQEPDEGGALYWGCSNQPDCTTRIYMVAV